MGEKVKKISNRHPFAVFKLRRPFYKLADFISNYQNLMLLFAELYIGVPDIQTSVW